MVPGAVELVQLWKIRPNRIGCRYLGVTENQPEENCHGAEEEIHNNGCWYGLVIIAVGTTWQEPNLIIGTTDSKRNLKGI